MGKIVLIISFLSMSVFAQELQVKNSSLESTCLTCHKEQQIPSSLIYKRYLMKYSTNGRMEEAMFKYLKDPEKEQSIMPNPFFLKFPMKEKQLFNDENLRKHIRMYLEKFDMKKRLMLEK